MQKLMKLILALSGVVAIATFSSAQELTVQEIVQKANLVAYYEGNDGSADVKMTITDAQGRTRNREFRILRMDTTEGGEQKFYVYFRKPSDVSKMAYMVWKHLDRDDDRWLYLPALDLVRRIASSDKRSSFVGSHFVYEDVSGRGTEADNHELVETTADAYKIKNIPKDPKGVEFKYYLVWVRKDNFVPVKAEYYNDRDQVVRTIEALEVQDIQGHPTVTRSQAVDLERKGQTQMEFSNIKYDVGLTPEIFEERYLRQPPLQWTK
jgi:hypothetical protein